MIALRRYVSAIALAAACAAPAGPQLKATATRPARRLGKIVFSSDRGGPWRIWVMKADGSGARPLLDGEKGAADVDPSFDPEGTKVLFTSTRGGKPGVWSVAAGGGKPVRICDGDQAEWSPDGKRIALRRGGRIVARDVASGAEKTVTPDGWTGCSGPAWSPDGKTVAFARRQKGANAIWLVASGGGTPKLLYDKKGACEPHFSPDGKRIVYETETHVWSIGADGKANRMVTWYGGLQRYPRFGPRGQSIIFCQGASPKGPWELYVVPAAGGTPRKLSEDGSDMYPHWR